MEEQNDALEPFVEQQVRKFLFPSLYMPPPVLNDNMGRVTEE